MDYIVETQFEGPGFVAVPNAVAQMPGLSPDALGMLVWLASLPKGYAIRRATLLERFSIGKDRWQRIARDLSAVGALVVEKKRGPDGRFSTRYLVRWPDPSAVAAEPEPGFPAPGEPAPVNPPKMGGKPAKSGRKTRLSIKNKIQKTSRARSRTPDARPMGGGSGRSSVVNESRPSDPWARAASSAQAGLKWLHPDTGLWCDPSEFPVSAPVDSVALATVGQDACEKGMRQ